MRKRWWLAVVVAALVAASVTAAVMVSRAQGSPTLQPLSAAQLLAKVAAASKTQTAISGDVAWSNGLVPGSGLSSLLSGQNAAPTSLSGLALGGSGRLWLRQGSGLRLEVQGTDGDFVLIAGKHGLWTYSSATDTATRYTLAAGKGVAASPAPQVQPSPVNLIAAISADLQRFASIGTVNVSQESVAGRPSYLLIMTPTSTATTVRSVQVAIDARTFVPLRLQVFAKGDGSAVLSAGFTSVSYGRLGSGLFGFTPPSGTTVRQQALPSASSLLGQMPVAKTKPDGLSTLAQAEAKAQALGLQLIAPSGSALPASLSFQGATVGAPGKAHGAIALLRYGTGFGSIALIETRGMAAAGVASQLARLPHALLSPVRIAGHLGYELRTSLINVAMWHEGGTTVVAVGAVPVPSLNRFLAAIR